MKCRLGVFVCFCVCMGFVSPSSAAEAQMRLFAPMWTPAMVSLVTPLQVTSRDSDVIGFRLDIIYGACRDFKGLDLGLLNRVDGDCVAWQLGVYNHVNTFRGWQVGALNIAKRMKGLQVGVINYAEMAWGVQIGLVNVIADSDLPFFPIVNMTF